MSQDIPSQVRIRTDADDGYAHRYESIQQAKDVFGVGNNTAAVIHATEHAHQDLDAKRDALDFLADHVGDDVLAEVADRLSTREMQVAVERTVTVDTE
ncbi:hypothetical protein [Haloarcula sp. JP-L23]|uniref:DUF7692 domain-containing protein n=1 Tax=Haloarcula sp. JP-L23 TaxID=2716717 RepID=UPI00140F32BA|nr:hypothetical protein G9465_14830 [Haloarcula sp. JP-L23]